MHIPIQNIYFLLCYAWDKLEESEKIKVDIDDFNSLIELYAKVVYEGTLHILKAGIDRNYITVTDAIPGIKGKLLFGDSLKQNSFKKGKAVCEYDELSTNILHNQILKTTIDSLLRIKELSNGITPPIKYLNNQAA
jgi:5-methylcytosine-specific restriction enzyme subunit McrC